MIVNLLMILTWYLILARVFWLVLFSGKSVVVLMVANETRQAAESLELYTRAVTEVSSRMHQLVLQDPINSCVYHICA